jgi:hypothetical protein
MEWCFIIQDYSNRRVYVVEAESTKILRYKLKQEKVTEYLILDSGYREEITPVYLI